ncbi:MAG: hypothetical protein R3B96_18725 [Pirellulaceae bacterium]|nr:hypothetical protein [Planctomycetales bacterium]
MPHEFPLNHLEHFFYWDDHPGFPNSLACRMRCRGKFDRDAARAAAKLLQERHPMIAGQVACSPRNKCRWVPRDSPPIVEFSRCDDFSVPPVLRPFDLTREPGARIVVRETEEDSEIWFMTHHACCDGLGGMQCVGDYLILCDNLMRERDPQTGLRKVDTQGLTNRGRLFRSRWENFKHLVWEPIGLYGLAKFFYHRPVDMTLASPAKSAETDEPASPQPSLSEKPKGWIEPHCATLSLDARETELLVKHAEKRGVTVNDVLARDLMFALVEWAEDVGIELSDRRPIRLFVPMNTRGIGDRRLSACNHVSLVYLDRKPSMIRQRGSLVGSISFEMKAIQNWKLSSTFRGVLRLLQHRPGMLQGMLSKPYCRATALFTNLGDFYQRLPLERVEGGVRVGSAAIERIELLAPVRPKTPLSVSAFRFLDCQQLSLHYDPWQISKAHIDRLSNALRASLQKTLAAQ